MVSESRGRVLFAEDEQERNRRIGDVLRIEGYEVETATTVSGCMRRLMTEEWDVLLLDIMMPPGVDEAWQDIDPIDGGLALLRRLRAGELGGERSNLPVIVLTATTRHADEIESLTNTTYLEKPASLAEVVAAASAAVGKEAGPGE